MRQRNPSVAALAIVTLVMVATLLLGTLGAVDYIVERRDARAALEREATTTANQLSAGLALPVWNFDRPQIDKIIESAMQAPEVHAVTVQQRDVSALGGIAVHARLRDENGGVSASSGDFSPVGLLAQERSITASGEPLGSVKIFLTTKIVDQRLRRSLFLLVGRIILFDLILIGSLYALLRRIVLLPLRSVEQYAAAVSSGGSRSLTVSPRRFSGEIESLRTSIEKMIALLDERYAALAKSRAMVTTILNSVPLSVFWKDQNSVYLGCNQVYADAIGIMHPDEIVGKTDFDLWPREAAESYRTHDQHVIQSAKPKRYFLEIKQPANGSDRWLDVTKVPLIDADRNIYGVLGVHADVTEQRQTEEEYRLLFEQNVVGIVICDVICDESGKPIDYRLVRANPAYDRLTGLQREQQIGKTSEELNWQWPPEVQNKILSLAIAGGEFFYERFNESLGRHYEVSVFSPRRGQFALIFNDVTERKRSEAMMLESEKMRTIAGLAAGMAHEINNPLAGMLQNAQVMLNRVSGDLPANKTAAERAGTTTEAVQSYLEQRGILGMLQSIRASGERAADIVANMLSFSRRDRSQMSLQVLPDLIDQAIALAHSDYDLKKNYDFKSLDVVREYAAALPGVPCRAGEIQQVMLNLLKNAAQAMHERGERSDSPRIVVRTMLDGSHARIEVEDNGPGASESVCQQMFEPFYTTKDPQSGTGLGLFVTYFIITRNHAGTIEVNSTVGVGTRFTIRLPLEQNS